MKTKYLIRNLILAYLSLFLVGCSNLSNMVKAPNWSDQLSAAENAAKNIDHDAYLWQVVASPNSKVLDDTSPALLVVFLYRQPSGRRLKVSFEDTDIQSTINVDRSGEIPIDRTSDENRKRSADLKTVQISPSQVLDQTIQDGRLFSNQQASTTNPIIGLYLSDEVPKEFHVSSAWKVTYIAARKNLNLWIDAHDGKIIMRSEELN